MIGLYGGSFDPIHQGHTQLAKSLLSKYKLQTIYLVPAKQNPLKTIRPVASPLDRLHMLQLAIREEKENRLSALDWEIKSNEPSYTIHTLQHLLETVSKDVALILGNEVFHDLPRWHQAAAIVKNCQLIVVLRNGESARIETILHQVGVNDARKTSTNKWIYHGDSRWTEICDVPTLPFSASALRKSLPHRNALEDKPDGLHLSVWNYIKEKRLYSVK